MKNRLTLGLAVATLCLTTLTPASAKTVNTLGISAWFPDNWTTTQSVGGLDGRDDGNDIDVVIRARSTESEDESAAISAFLDDRLDSFKIEHTDDTKIAGGTRVVSGSGMDGGDKVVFTLYALRPVGSTRVLMLCTGGPPDLRDDLDSFRRTAESIKVN